MRQAVFAFSLLFFASALADVRNGSVTCERYAAGARFDFQCWASEGLADGEGAVYVFLEFAAGAVKSTLQNLMKAGKVPPGICISFNAGKLVATAGGSDRDMRACEFDQPGTDFPSAIAEEIVPAAEELLGMRASRSPDLHFIAGGSSGGHAAFNACWYRNDRFRRCYCSSPTLSNMRAGNQTMALVRKCETRPIRAYLTSGTVEPDYSSATPVVLRRTPFRRFVTPATRCATTDFRTRGIARVSRTDISSERC